MNKAMIKKPLGHKIYKQFKSDIAHGVHKPGEHLSEKFLTEKYNISRTLLREVISQLDSQGFLLVEPNRGAFVPKLSIDDYDEVFNIIIRCESYAVRLFVEKHFNQHIVRKLKKFHQAASTQLDSFNRKEWVRMNGEFHEQMYLNCGNRFLSDLIRNSWLRINRFRLFRADIKSIKSYYDQHGKVLAAVAERDGKKAERMMAEHLEEARRNRIKILKEYQELF